ncbi:mitotic checkpoint regulator, MAD2B-interacting-domain-containing protein [Colletotrichum godetiae]|uniref:Mitotic checkpoint regulator, MAD2B-interacting-domain-containing protein n=1 Tax=Colletotrichum godetiae TaxID=1209918 RepID=A0AAJ0EXQ9_9PEZI|nr:mitotic checkpoint regulator, MAD2B-interacting-domain-containing protein [Colletotrichum godetiae]KAK1691359.1 mitotic checkpoint regulator, MAD2B-interacting-domain-containing protein [Colletotrichum godetiae]
MGLVDYSESSGSEDEAPVKPTVSKPTTTATGKKPFQKVVDRSNPGKIVVSLPSTQPEASKATLSNDEPPAKRARTGNSGGRFSGFNSFLPAPKNAAAKAAASVQSSGSNGSSLRPAFQLKTGAEPGFSREKGGSDTDGLPGSAAGGLSLPPPKAQAQPSIPEGMKPADEVKLVGKPMMFKPLSVARNTKKKKTVASMAPVATAPKPASTLTVEPEVAPAPAPAPKKVSLFSIETEETSTDATTTKTTGAYEPLFETEQAAAADNGYAEYAAQAHFTAPTTVPNTSDSLDTIANDLNLSAAARRELFGRQKGGNIGAAPQTASRVINFNTDQEYKHNEEIRAAGQQQIHNPVRAIAPGKHSLQQLVNQVQNQREALEDSFAKGKSNRKEASSRYGW